MSIKKTAKTGLDIVFDKMHLALQDLRVAPDCSQQVHHQLSRNPRCRNPRAAHDRSPGQGLGIDDTAIMPGHKLFTSTTKQNLRIAVERGGYHTGAPFISLARPIKGCSRLASNCRRCGSGSAPPLRLRTRTRVNRSGQAAAPNPEQGQPREGSKEQIVLDLPRRKDGAAMAEIAKATGWRTSRSGASSPAS